MRFCGWGGVILVGDRRVRTTQGPASRKGQALRIRGMCLCAGEITHRDQTLRSTPRPLSHPRLLDAYIW